MPLDPIALKALAIELAASLPPAPPAEVGDRPIDLSPRAKSMRAIRRIADVYGWHDAITQYLEERGVEYISDLSGLQLDELHALMLGYVDAAEVGASPAGYLPAY